MEKKVLQISASVYTGKWISMLLTFIASRTLKLVKNTESANFAKFLNFIMNLQLEVGLRFQNSSL